MEQNTAHDSIKFRKICRKTVKMILNVEKSESQEDVRVIVFLFIMKPKTEQKNHLKNISMN